MATLGVPAAREHPLHGVSQAAQLAPQARAQPRRGRAVRAARRGRGRRRRARCWRARGPEGYDQYDACAPEDFSQAVPLLVAEREELKETGLGSTARCVVSGGTSSQQRARVLTESRRVASLRPRSAGLTALTSAPRTLVQPGSCRQCPLIHPLHVVVAVLSRITPFPATVDTLLNDLSALGDPCLRW